MQAGQCVQHALAGATAVGDHLDFLGQIRRHHLAHVQRLTIGQVDDQRSIKVDERIGDRYTIFAVTAIAAVQAVNTARANSTVTTRPSVLAVAAIGPVLAVLAIFDGRHTLFNDSGHTVVLVLQVRLNFLERLNDELNIAGDFTLLHLLHGQHEVINFTQYIVRQVINARRTKNIVNGHYLSPDSMFQENRSQHP